MDWVLYIDRDDFALICIHLDIDIRYKLYTPNGTDCMTFLVYLQ